MNKELTLEHLPSLNREIRKILKEYKTQKFPLIINYNEGMEYPKFKITIEKEDIDVYTDSKGQKWKKI